MKSKPYGFTLVHTVLSLVLIVFILGVGYLVYQKKTTNSNETSNSKISSFDECVAAGNPIMESYPEQCSADGQTFTNKTQTNSNSEPINDEQQIRESIINYCIGQGISDSNQVANIIDTNMKDSTLYIKEGNFARLSASCGEGGFRSFLQKKNNQWSILGQGQMNTIACTVLDNTGIPNSVAATCFDTNGEERPVK